MRKEVNEILGGCPPRERWVIASGVVMFTTSELSRSLPVSCHVHYQ